MKAIKNYRENKTAFFIIIAVILSLSACHKEYVIIDGAPGRAYLSFIWTDIEPDFVDPGTFDIPDQFYWDEYYRISSGFYTMYYDGAYYEDGNLIEYAWEIDYEIFENPGELGSINYVGRDGVDNYFTLECNPFGPWMYQDFKSANSENGLKVLEQSPNKVVIEKTNGDFTLKATYKKVEKRSQQ